MSCGLCGKVRAHLPEAIRERLAVVEARIRARKDAERKRDPAYQAELKRSRDAVSRIVIPPAGKS
jgi:hypothetical protein